MSEELAPVVSAECEWTTCNALTDYEFRLCDQRSEFYAVGFKSGTFLAVCLAHAEVIRACGETVERIDG